MGAQLAISTTPLSAIPYCGPPPVPDAIWSRWNLDPILIAALCAAAALYAAGAVREARAGHRLSRSSIALFYGGWLTAAAALVSPLCPLSVSLFAARVSQHAILGLVAAPLIVLGSAGSACRALVPGIRTAAPGGSAIPSAPLCASGAFAAMLWLWHAPGPYAATFASSGVYWLMHLSLFAAALWLWQGLLDRSPRKTMHRVAAGLISSTQMGFLGALITLAPRPLYEPHALTTAAWGLTPLQDQQLGGGIMWVPGCLVFLAASVLAFWPLSRGDARRTATPSRTAIGMEVRGA